MRRRSAGRRIPGSAAILVALLFSLSSAASTSRSAFGVGANVLARATIAAESSPELLEITASDLSRGYVDVASRLTIANTSPYGYALDVWPAAGMFRAVDVGGVGAPVRLSADGGSIVARGQRGQALGLDLTIRFALAPGLAPGRYPWPLRFQVRPLSGP